MKQFSQQFYKKAITTVKLQAAEKRELRERLVAYMEYHPLPAKMRSQKVSEMATSTVMTETFALVRVPFSALFKYGATAAVILLVIVPFVAEKAVPGDTLYAVKVQFNEEVRSTLTFDSFQKVEWETTRLNRRIAEARLLASEGRLTEAVEVEVAEAVRTHTENAKREIEVLRAEDADQATIASIALDTTLEVQSTALKGDSEVFTTNNEVTISSAMSSLIADAIDESRDKSIEPEASSTLPVYEKLMARVEQNTTRLYELRTVLSEVVPAEELADVSRRVEDLDRSVQSAISLSETDQFAARMTLIEVLQRAQRLIVYMTELEMAKTVDIESLIPVVLTEEERQVAMASSTASLAVKLEQLAVMLAGVEVAEVREKALAGQLMVLELSSQMASSTEYTNFIALSQEAHALANDSITLLKQYYIPVEGSSEGQGVEAEVSEEETASTTQVTGEEVSGEIDSVDVTTGTETTASQPTGR